MDSARAADGSPSASEGLALPPLMIDLTLCLRSQTPFAIGHNLRYCMTQTVRSSSYVSDHSYVPQANLLD